jgi:hypothetical protein
MHKACHADPARLGDMPRRINRGIQAWRARLCRPAAPGPESTSLDSLHDLPVALASVDAPHRRLAK